MIKRVLVISLSIFIIALIIFWLWSGGLSAAARTAKDFVNPVNIILGNGSSTGMAITLPWQSDSLTRGPDISDYVGEADRINQDTQEEERAAIEAQYGPDIAKAQTFGDPSPYVGKVMITDSNATESDTAGEYVGLAAPPNNSVPISLAGWFLQSAVSGLRVNIPLGAPHFMLGVVNNVQSISLEPGASATVLTGTSPVGTSFQENICTGYLNELQSFTPELSAECPSPSEAMPVTADNIRIYGDNCIDYIRTLQSCHFPPTVPATLSPACRSFIANNFSYNGCTNIHRNDPTFRLPSWRVYLGFRTELWRNTHDVIRLLDDQGQIVDVFTY
ncbi:MAG: hypothetical protein AAB804_01850 [Patescibacteria group bacterium]